MIDTADPITYQLAALIGAVLIAVAIGFWRNPQAWSRMADDLESSPTLMFVAAFSAVLFGALILLLPGGWSDPLAAAVSAIGLLSLIKGLVLLAMPDSTLRIIRPMLRSGARIWAVIASLFGFILLIAGIPGLIS